jgi:hypothetical protein
VVLSNLEFDSNIQVYASPANNPVSPLSLWERVRVRAVAARSCSFSVPA